MVSETFASKKLLERHRMVNKALVGPDGKLSFHSLRISAKTPAEWAESNKTQPAPKCAGGDGLK